MEVIFEKVGKTEIIYIKNGGNNTVLPGNFRNFAGEKRKNPKTGEIVNDEGKSNFNLNLKGFSKEQLDNLADMGLKINEYVSDNVEEYGDDPLRFAKVNVAFGGRQDPELFIVEGKRKKPIKRSQLIALDKARFSKIHLTINLYHKTEGKTTLYLDKGYFFIQQDPISALMEEYEVSVNDDDDLIDLPFDED